MAAATSGAVRNVHTLAEAYCNLVMACTNAGAWDRAAEWCEHVEEFARTHETAPLWGACRTVHAEVLLARGHWTEAEVALTAALETAGRYIPELGAPAVASLAELRVAQGRLDEAERLLAGREETPAALRSLALLRIADGRPGVAVALLTRGLRAVGGDVMRAAQMLAALVDAHLAVGDTDRAAEASLDAGGAGLVDGDPPGARRVAPSAAAPGRDGTGCPRRGRCGGRGGTGRRGAGAVRGPGHAVGGGSGAVGAGARPWPTGARSWPPRRPRRRWPRSASWGRCRPSVGPRRCWGGCERRRFRRGSVPPRVGRRPCPVRPRGRPGRPVCWDGP